MIIFQPHPLKNQKMPTIKSTREIYSNIPKQEPKVQELKPLDPSLLNKVVDNLNKNPVIAPKVK